MLHVKYPIPIEGAKMQSTNRADRRHCALTAALAALGRDENLSFLDVVTLLSRRLSSPSISSMFHYHALLSGLAELT